MNALTKPGQPERMAEAADWVTFLRPLLLAVANRPERDDFVAKCQTIAFAMVGVPVDMLTTWRQQESLRRFKFFPTPAELTEWLGADLAERKRVSQPALPAPKPEPRAERTPEEIAEARAKVQAFMAERNAAGGPAEMAPVEPRYLSDGHLLASLEKIAAEGGPCAGASRLRANALRARMQAQRVSA